jgi:transcriptional regulator with PAS, ATPase and Fis domain
MGDLSRFFRDDNSTSELLDVLPCGVLVFTEDGTVVKLNHALEQVFGVRNAEVAGESLGKALCCINSCEDKDRCGSVDGCSECEVRNLALAAIYSNEKKRRRVAMRVSIDHHVKDVDFLICAAPFKIGSERLSLLTIENLSDLKLSLPPRSRDGFHGIVCRDEKMKALCETVKQVAQTEAPVLIQGESGTGKELVALAVHRESRRARGRFVTVNCGALPVGLLESELFGHVKGAFTGALNDKKGRFELADRGTIFLDEVAELTPEMQVKFLRVLQDGGFERVGSTLTQRVDVRIISATNIDLEKAVAASRFRRDLYYRLCVMPVTIPPLRERPGDIELLAKHFLKEFGSESFRGHVEFSLQALALFKKHDWPGNCRELQNAVQYALVKCRGDTIEPEHLPPSLFAGGPSAFVRPRREPRLDEKSALEALQRAGGNKRRAAELLGVSRSTLYRFFDRLRGEE